MNARLEQKLLIENKIKRKLALLPKYMEDFELILSEQEENEYITRLNYINHVSDFLKYLFVSKRYKLNKIEELKRITEFDIMNWKRSIEYTLKDGKQYPVKNTTIATKISAIKKFFTCFEEKLGKNPAKKIKRPEIKNKQAVVLEDDEFTTIFRNMQNGVGSQRARAYSQKSLKRDMAIIYVLSCTGIRVEPLVQLNIEDLDLNNRTIVVTSKGDKSSVKDLNDEAFYVLCEYLEERKQMDIDTNALFVSNRKRRMTGRTVEKMVEKYSAGISKNITPHVFRKTFGTRVYNATGDIKLVADLLDHINIRTTSENYILKDSERTKKIVNQVNLVGGK